MKRAHVRGAGGSSTGRRDVLLGLVAGVGACASPEPTYYTLAPAASAKTEPPSPRAPRTVELRRFGLAGYLDRPEIVRTGGDYQLRLVSGERWGEPLGDLIGRIVAENLTIRLPGLTVFTQAGRISGDSDATVEIDIQRFDADAAGPVTLLAQAAVRRGLRGALVNRTVRLQAMPTGAATRDMVAAMSRMLGELSDVVADLIRQV